MQGFLHVAFLSDLHATPPAEREQRTAKYLNVRTRRDAKQYLMEVHHKVKSQAQSQYE
jgi:hypothetical protein